MNREVLSWTVRLSFPKKEFIDIQRVVISCCIKQCNTCIWVLGAIKEEMIGIFHSKTTATCFGIKENMYFNVF